MKLKYSFLNPETGVTARVVHKGDMTVEQIQLTFSFKEGATPQDIASKLRFHAGLLEGMAPKAAASVKNTTAPVAAATAFDDDEEEEIEAAPKKKATKKAAPTPAASFDDDEDEAAPVEAAVDITDDEDEDTFTEAPKKTKKAKGPTLEMVNDACKAKAKATSREAVVKILMKNFKTKTLSDITADKYQAVINAMAV